MKYSEAVFLGIDSLQRTGECWQEAKENGVSFDIRYGYHLMTIELPNLVMDGKNMSGFVRIRENSVHLSYTVHNISDKCITLNGLKIEKMENVEFGASRPDYDGTNLEGLFKLVVRPTLNGIIMSNFTRIEAALQPLCKIRDIEKNAMDLLTSLL